MRICFVVSNAKLLFKWIYHLYSHDPWMGVPVDLHPHQRLEVSFFYVDYACRYVVDSFQYSLKTLNFISFYVYGTFACMHNCVSLVCLVHVEVGRGQKSLWKCCESIMWVLRTEPQSCKVSALSHWAIISPAPLLSAYLNCRLAIVLELCTS